MQVPARTRAQRADRFDVASASAARRDDEQQGRLHFIPNISSAWFRLHAVQFSRCRQVSRDICAREGELSDAATALDWLQSYNENARSAGSPVFIWCVDRMQLLMRRPEITSFVSVAPPANMYDFSFLAPCPSSGLFLSGDLDDIVPPDSIETLVGKLRQQRGIEIDHHTIGGANHFFHAKLEELEQTVGQYLDRSMVEHAEQAVIGYSPK